MLQFQHWMLLFVYNAFSVYKTAHTGEYVVNLQSSKYSRIYFQQCLTHCIYILGCMIGHTKLDRKKARKGKDLLGNQTCNHVVIQLLSYFMTFVVVQINNTAMVSLCYRRVEGPT